MAVFFLMYNYNMYVLDLSVHRSWSERVGLIVEQQFQGLQVIGSLDILTLVLTMILVEFQYFLKHDLQEVIFQFVMKSCYKYLFKIGFQAIY